MSARRRWRDVFQRWSVVWLSDRGGEQAGETVGYRVLWTIHATLDQIAESITQALFMWWPGYGSPAALPLVGQSRGLLRGHDDTDADYAARLRAWRQKALLMGTRVGLALALHEYLPTRPQVDIVNRAGTWTRVAADGTISQFRGVAWDWDSVSNPERAGYFSELWIIIRTPYAQRPGTLGTAFVGMTPAQLAATSTGHLCPIVDEDDARGIIATVKSAAARVRAVIWTTSATRFDPTNPSTLPDGTWGDWHKVVAGRYVMGNRDITECRYWEPN